MRRRFNQDLLPTSWNKIDKHQSFDGERFGNWIMKIQTVNDVNTVKMEDWGFNPQTLARWRKGKQRRRPTSSVLLRFCMAITQNSKSGITIDTLWEDAQQFLS